MRPGAIRDTLTRLRPCLVVAALCLAGAAALTLSLLASSSPAARAAALDDPTPTYNPLIVPTAAAPSSSGLTSTALSTNPNGFALAITLSCAITIAGLIIAAVTLTLLLRGGYGPFLRAMLPERLRGKVKSEFGSAPRRTTRGARRSRTRDDAQGWDAPAQRPRQAQRGSTRDRRFRS